MGARQRRCVGAVMAYAVHLRDLAPHYRGTDVARGRPCRKLWDEIVLRLFSNPDRVWRLSDLVDAIYADDPDGGPLHARSVVAQAIHRQQAEAVPPEQTPARLASVACGLRALSA